MRLAVFLTLVATGLAGVVLAVRLRPPIMPWLPHALLAGVTMTVWLLVLLDEGSRDGAAPRFGFALVLLVIALGIATDRQRRRRGVSLRGSTRSIVNAHLAGAAFAAALTAVAFTRSVDRWFADAPELGAWWLVLIAGWCVLGAAVAVAWRLIAPPAIGVEAEGVLGGLLGALGGAVAVFLVGTGAWLSLLGAALGGVFVGWAVLLMRIPSGRAGRSDRTEARGP